ncbi:MAG: hypothetical protein A3E87_06760 [Gammaproteobacteria bacterium RIFCSPHIGHO2_12_FULL_35_23]|nr:MAG: hypothetical protein A3E87_06760 [Gammaproteobacteria bacterium RIFCSPHIGHO2_12_FULL_35_23]
MFRKLIIGSCLILSNVAMANNSANLIIAPNQTQVFWLHNISQQTIIIDHQTSNPGASAGWGSILHPGNWSLLLLANDKASKQLFILTCANEQPYQRLDCQKVIKSGQLKGTAVPLSLKNYQFWISEDQPLSGLMAGIKKWKIGYTSQQLQSFSNN